MAIDEANGKAEDKVDDEAEDKVGDEEEDEDEDDEETEDIPMRLLPMPVHNYCLHYDLKIMVPPADNPVAAVVDVLKSFLSQL
jgi:hypothetical protein